MTLCIQPTHQQDMTNFVKTIRTTEFNQEPPNNNITNYEIGVTLQQYELV